KSETSTGGLRVPLTDVAGFCGRMSGENRAFWGYVTMKNIFKAVLSAGAAMLGTTAMTGAASAEVEISGNVALTSDYVFRGYSQANEDPAIQGGLDLTAGMFYPGVWASSLSE